MLRFEAVRGRAAVRRTLEEAGDRSEFELLEQIGQRIEKALR